MAAEEVDSFPALFDELELLLQGAGEEVRDLLVGGFLEDIQNVASNRGIDPDVVLPFLGPASRAGWFELIHLWHGSEGKGWPGQTRDR